MVLGLDLIHVAGITQPDICFAAISHIWSVAAAAGGKNWPRIYRSVEAVKGKVNNDLALFSFLFPCHIFPYRDGEHLLIGYPDSKHPKDKI